MINPIVAPNRKRECQYLSPFERTTGAITAAVTADGVRHPTSAACSSCAEQPLVCSRLATRRSPMDRDAIQIRLDGNVTTIPPTLRSSQCYDIIGILGYFNGTPAQAAYGVRREGGSVHVIESFGWRRGAARTVRVLLGCRCSEPTTTGNIRGRVTDEAANPLPAATVVATNQETGFQRGAQTDDAGIYVVRFLPPGTYRVAARRIGQQASEVGGIRVIVGSTTPANFTLRTAACSSPAWRSPPTRARSTSPRPASSRRCPRRRSRSCRR